MSLQVSSDIKLPINVHISNVLLLVRKNIFLFITFSIIWAFMIEDLILSWIKSTKLMNSLELSIYGPYDWVEIQWTMVFLLSLISIMPYMCMSINNYVKIGIFPNEKSWITSILILNLIFLPFLLILIWVIILPEILSSFSLNGELVNIGNQYDASTIFKFTIGLSLLVILFSFTTISLSLARLIGFADSQESNLINQIIFFSGSITFLIMPNEFEGLKLISAILIVYLANNISKTIPHYPIGNRSFDVLSIENNTGKIDKIAIVDCSCEGACPKFPVDYKPIGIAIPRCTALCLNSNEQDSLVEMISRYGISKLIITGCDGSPLPIDFHNNIVTLNCDIFGLEWMDSQLSSDETWKKNTLKDSTS